MTSKRYKTLASSLDRLESNVDNFVLYPTKLHTAPFALESASDVFSQLFAIYVFSEKIYDDMADRFLSQAARMQSQLKSVCLTDGDAAKKIALKREAYKEKIQLRATLVEKMKEKIDSRELRKMMAAAFPERI